MQTHNVKVIQAIDFLIGQSWINLKWKKNNLCSVYMQIFTTNNNLKRLSIPYTIDIPMENLRLLFD